MDFDLERTREILERTPGTLQRLLGDLSQEWIRGTEGPETWSPFDVVGHLIHGEKTDWIERAKTILEQGDSRTFTPFDRTAFFEKSRGKTLAELLGQFEQLRQANLRWLDEQQLTHVQLRLTGDHPELGRVTLAQLLATWAVHDLSHIAQVARVMAKQYDVAVGPWKEYLPILSR